jgi:RNA polymerase subunit RPABC4/transcription elongation factor Spt4
VVVLCLRSGCLSQSSCSHAEHWGHNTRGSCLRVVWGFEICLLLLPFGAFCPSLCGLVSFHWLGLTIILDWSQGTRADRFTLAVLKDNFD